MECKYCGKDGFASVKSLSIHRRFSKKCYEQWKKEQDEIDNAKTKVKCEICGEYLRNISNTHLKKHGITQQEYKKQFPEAPIFSDGLLNIQKEKRESTIYERYGNDKSIYQITEESFIKNNGIEEGKKLWKEYLKNREHQGSLEFYCNKYGDEEGAKIYKERCSALKGKNTLSGFISKYGEEIGTKKYNEFCKIQSKCRSLESYINKYGEEKGNKIYQEINKKKSITLGNFILKYGEEEGKKRFQQLIDKRQEFAQSDIALELFNILLSQLNSEKIYFYGHPKEFGVMIQEDKVYYMLDFYCQDNNKVIEFYGDYWHANPKIYNENDIVDYPNNKSLTAKDVWDKDEQRIARIKKQLKCDILIIWQKDFIENKEETIKKAINFLKNT